MKQKLLLLAGFAFLLCSAVTGQTKLVEKVTKKGSDIVIPYEKYTLPN
jgi:zinc protease